MPDTHDHHPHQHGEGCGHTAIQHNGHVDYLHDGHLHHQKPDGTVEEHAIPVTDANPDACQPHDCGCHDDGHVHGPGCGHEPVPHGDHIDYLVVGKDGKAHLHHPHGDHCDDHGVVDIA
jgi:hypothetical protein